jgi:predicted ribosome quality control (RQC) complex YloA/Tae2 family protein
MGMESAVIGALCIELSEGLVGAKVRAIEQFDPWEFAVKTDRGDLLVSCHQKFKRIVLARADEQPVSTHFARTAEDILRHAKIRRIEQKDLDRVVEIGLLRDDLLTGAAVFRIVVELVGSSGNAIVLSSEGRVLATLRRSRRNAVGSAYRPPRRPCGIDPAGMGPDDVAAILGKDKSRGLAEAIQRTVMGFGPLLSEEAAFRAGLDPVVGVDSLTSDELAKAGKEILALHDDLIQRRYCPTVYYRGGAPAEYSCFSLSHLESMKRKHLTSTMEAVHEFYANTLVSERIAEKKRFLLRSLKSSICSATRRRAKQAEDLRKAGQAEQYRAKGDAILASLGRIPKGATSATLEDPHEPGKTLEVKLAPGKSPQDTAQEYYKKYKKLKRAVPVMQARLVESTNALRELENLEPALTEAATEDELGRLAEALSKKGVLQRPSARRGRAEKQYRVFVTSGGWEVIVGRSRQENDEITFHVSKPKDIFFHVSSAPGSHTIMRVQGRAGAPSKEDIEEAASIAAYYSKARTSGLVPVSYTERRYVRKPRKAPAGTVIVERVKTVMVEPRKPEQ